MNNNQPQAIIYKVYGKRTWINDQKQRWSIQETGIPSDCIEETLFVTLIKIEKNMVFEAKEL